MFLDNKRSKYKEAFYSTPAGEFVLGSLLDFSGLYRSSFNESSTVMAFNEGKRAVALHIIQLLDLSEADVRAMVGGYKQAVASQEGNLDDFLGEL